MSAAGWYREHLRLNAERREEIQRLRDEVAELRGLLEQSKDSLLHGTPAGREHMAKLIQAKLKETP